MLIRPKAAGTNAKSRARAASPMVVAASRDVRLHAPARPWSVFHDVILSAAIFILAAIACGRVYRFPFDDEVFTLNLIRALHLRDMPGFFLNDGDVNPPLSYLLFYSGSAIGVGAAGLRWISLACTAGALAIWHWLTLSSLDEEIPVSTRLLIAVVFGLTPMALGQGDAMRWYPPFALAVAAAFLLYLRSPRRWMLGGIAMGIAADISFVAILPLLSICFHRYVVERKFLWKEDAAFFAFAGLLAIPGFISFAEFMLYFPLAPQLVPGVLKRVGITLLGFFGGCTLSLGQFWIEAPAIAAIAYLSYLAIVATPPASRARTLSIVVLLTTAGPALFTLIGFAEPRGYLFLAPMVSALVSLGIVYALENSLQLAPAACTALIVCAVSVCSHLRASDSPFKRNAAIPFRELIDFVRTNARGSTEVLTMEPTTAYELAGTAGLCIGEFEPSADSWYRNSCAAPKPQTVIVIKGYPLDRDDPVWRAKVEQAIAGKRPIAQAQFGQDQDADLKSWLTGAPLPRSLIEAVIYR